MQTMPLQVSHKVHKNSPLKSEKVGEYGNDCIMQQPLGVY